MFHPESLLDDAAHGNLPPWRRPQLEAHLAVCATCRLELALRADFAEELAEPNEPVPINRARKGSAREPSRPFDRSSSW